MKKLNKKQQKLVDAHYQEALQIGRSFKSSVLYDDEKETIAVMALMRAAKSFDPNRPVKIHTKKLTPKKGRSLFNTYLYRAIINSLLSHKQTNIGNGKFEPQQKRIPKNQIVLESTIEDRSAEQGRQESLATLIAEPAVSPTRDLEYNETIADIHAHLDERERVIFDALNQDSGATYEELGKMLNISRQRVHQIHLRIQKTVQQLIKRGDIQWTLPIS